MIHRIEHDDNFTVISNDIVRNPDLSDGAKVLLLYLLTCSDDWDFNVKGISTCLGISTGAVSARLKELQEFGFVTIKKVRTGQGKISSWIWEIYEQPHSNLPNVDLPNVVSPNVDLPNVENLNGKEILIEINTNSKEIPKERNKPDSENFELILENLVSDSEVKEVFREFIKVRKKQKNRPFTEHALELLIKKAEKLGNGNPETMKKIVEQSIERGWSGLFPLKEPTPINKFEPDENPFVKLAREEGFTL